MAHSVQEFSDVAERLEAYLKRLKVSGVEDIIKGLISAADQVGRAFSGSWFGYHARVYYAGLHSPPPGAHFDPQWGLKGRFQGSVGDWREFDFDVVKDHVRAVAGNPDMAAAQELYKDGCTLFDDAKEEILSLLSSALSAKDDAFLKRLQDEVNSLKILRANDVLSVWSPSGKFAGYDGSAISQGLHTPPHLAVKAEASAFSLVFNLNERLLKVSRRASNHLGRRAGATQGAAPAKGTSIFIGHGRSMAWRDLKDFIQDRLELPWEEFNRVPVAGHTNIARLQTMLESAAMAFLVLTGEDETADGKMQARMNVIHEAGLFQGRLGFNKAIVVLEEGCETFSNIEGLGQIRFPKGSIGAQFEEIRRVLEREGLIEG